MKPSPRVVLGIIASTAVLLAFLVAAGIFFKSHNSYLLLTSRENSFNLRFFIQKGDQDNFDSLLTKLGIPQDVQEGVQFQLDSTSSAKLEFISPIEVNIKLTDKTVKFSGETSVPAFSSQIEAQKIKLPNTTNLAIFAPNLSSFVKARLNIPENISSWFDHNLNSPQGSYLALYGSNADFSLLFKNNQINFDQLKDFKNPSGDPIYKEETNSDIKFHLLQIPTINPQNQVPQTLAFFKLEDYQVMSSSPDAAKTFIDSQKASDSIEFPKSQNIGKISLAVEYLNAGENQVQEPMKDFLLQNWQGLSKPKSKIAESLQNIKDASLTLKTGTFSGLINLK